MKVTVNWGSARPGGVDVMLAGLAHQTYLDFEVIFVDGLYHRRHRRVLDAVAASGLKAKFFHVPNHRHRADLWPAVNAGYNTGFALADGDIVILVSDYSCPPPDWIAGHVKYHNRPRLVMGRYVCKEFPTPVTLSGLEPKFYSNEVRPNITPEEIVAVTEAYDLISVFPNFDLSAKNIDLLSDSVYTGRDPKQNVAVSGPHTFLDCNTKNDSFPLESILVINGCDERYDEWVGPFDWDLGYRLCASGLESWVSVEATIYQLNPRQYMPNAMGCLSYSARTRGRGPEQEGRAMYEAVKSSGQIRAKNPIELRKLRSDIWHWRELSQVKQALLPRNTLSDEDYFAQ
jgi:glycosyltransferase involved in cell wall biosynthesis